MRIFPLALLITVVLTLSGCGGGGADIMAVDTYSFTGTVSSVLGTPPGNVVVGMPVTGTFSIDRGSIGSTNAATPNITMYPQTSLTAVHFATGGMTFNGTVGSYVATIGNNVGSRNFGGDQFIWDAADPALAAANALTSVTAHFVLADSTGLLFTNTSLPTTLAASSFDARSLLINGAGNAANWSIVSSIDTITKI
jgi:hypothetical protein